MAALIGDGHPQQGLIVAAPVMPHGRHRDAVGGGGGGGIHHIHRIHHRPQQPGHGRGHHRIGVQRRRLAVELDGNGGDPGTLHLSEESPQLAAEPHIGAQDRRFLGGDRGHVQRVGDGAVHQEVGHLLGHLKGDLLLRLGGAGAKMRGGDDVLHAEQRVVCGRFRLEHIQRGAGDMAAGQRRRERQLVNQPATRTIHDPHALLRLVQRVGRQNVARLLGQRRVQRDHVGDGQQLVQLDLLDADPARMFRGQERVEPDHLHLQPLRPVGDDRPDIAAADDAQRLAGDLGPHEARLFPFAGLGRFVRRRNLPCQREDHADGVLRRGDRVAEGRIHHHHAARRGGRNIDIVDPDAGPPDNLEIWRGRQNIRRHLGGGADGEAVIIADDGGEFLGGEARLHIDLDAALAEDVGSAGAELVTDQNFWHRKTPCRKTTGYGFGGGCQPSPCGLPS